MEGTGLVVAMIYAPMMAVSWDRPFTDQGWLFEPKLDGVRAVTAVDASGVYVYGRSGRQISGTYPELTSLRDVRAVLDGEIVAYDDDGKPSFERLQSRIHLQGHRALEAAASTPINYAVFDLLERHGTPVIGAPIEERAELLSTIDFPEPVIRVEQIPEHGEALFEAVVARSMEGIVAKRRGSRYRPGARSPDWRKIANIGRVRAVVGGYTRGEGGRSGGFGALLVGMWDGDRLRWAGAVGTGFDRAAIRAIRVALDEMERPDSPFHPAEGLPRDAVWVEPHLVAEIAYKEWTRAGRLRAPSFKGFSDRPAGSIAWDDEGPPPRER